MTALTLDANLGGRPPQALLDTVAPLDADLLRRYPDTTPLERRLADRFGIEAGRVLVTAGVDDAIDRACRTWAGPNRTMVVPQPSFEMFDHFGRLAGGVTVPVPWGRGRFPVAACRAALGPETGLVVMVSPNNPTGAIATAADLRSLAAAADGAIILLDHVYVEYSATDLTAAALDLPNVVVARTLSKAWGLAGCRVGYVMGDESAIGVLRQAGAPYAVSAPSVAVAMARLIAGDTDVRQHVARVRTERAVLEARLAALGLEPWPSEANFVLVDLGSRAARVLAGLAVCGIRVRAFPGRPGLETAVRISLPGAPAEFEQLLAALDATLDREVGP